MAIKGRLVSGAACAGAVIESDIEIPRKLGETEV
jgi:hypothetical protein